MCMYVYGQAEILCVLYVLFRTYRNTVGTLLYWCERTVQYSTLLDWSGLFYYHYCYYYDHFKKYIFIFIHIHNENVHVYRTDNTIIKLNNKNYMLYSRVNKIISINYIIPCHYLFLYLKIYLFDRPLKIKTKWMER